MWLYCNDFIAAGIEVECCIGCHNEMEDDYEYAGSEWGPYQIDGEQVMAHVCCGMNEERGFGAANGSDIRHTQVREKELVERAYRFKIRQASNEIS